MSEQANRLPRDVRAAPHESRRVHALRTLHDEVHNMLHRFLAGAPTDLSHPGWLDSGFPMPVADVTESETAYHVMVELPGVAQNDIDLSLVDDILTLKGEKREDHSEKVDTIHTYERNYGAFLRAFRVPDGIDRAKIEAVLDKGVLTVSLPKLSDQAPKKDKISIKIN